MNDVNSSITKICTVCGQKKPLREFHRRRHYMRNGYRSACKACTLAAARQTYRSFPSRVDPHKQRIRQRTRAAIRRGQLIPQPCAICQSFEDVEPHHPDYDAPDAHLVVQWLCRKHHALHHGKRAWTKQLAFAFAASPTGQDVTPPDDARPFFIE